MYINSMDTGLSKKRAKNYRRHIRQEVDEKIPHLKLRWDVVLFLRFINFRFDVTINRIPGVCFFRMYARLPDIKTSGRVFEGCFCG